MADERAQTVPQALGFHPEWFTDPVPPWLRDRLDVRVLGDLAKVHFDGVRATLKLQLETLDKVQAIVERGLRT